MLGEADDGWIRGRRARDGADGMFPPNTVLPAASIEWVEATHAFAAEQATELSLAAGDVLIVTARRDRDWWVGVCVASGARGVFPSNFVKVPFFGGGGLLLLL